MIIVKIVLKFFKILNSEAAPWQIAAGFVIGLFLGLTPLMSLHNALLICLLLIVRINVTSAIVAWGLFSAVSLAVSVPAARIGLFLLDMRALVMLWRFLTETPGLALFGLNNTLMLGSLCISIVLAPPVFFVVAKSVSYYRDSLKEKVDKWKILKALKMTKLAKLLRRAGRMA